MRPEPALPPRRPADNPMISDDLRRSPPAAMAGRFDPVAEERLRQTLLAGMALGLVSQEQMDAFLHQTAPAAAQAAEMAVGDQTTPPFDPEAIDVLAADLAAGDPAVARTWKAALGRRGAAALFDADDLVRRLTEPAGEGAARLAASPPAAVNLILGRSALGRVGRDGLYDGLQQLRRALGRDGEAWNALRAEHLGRIARTASGGAGFLKAWNDAKARDMRLVQALYAAEEIVAINRFAAASAEADKAGLPAPAASLGRLLKIMPWAGEALTGPAA